MVKRMILLTFACLCLCSNALPQTSAPAPAKAPVATVGGQAIYEDDLVPLMSAEMQQLRNQEYQIKRQALENVVNQKVLEAEAKKKGISAAKLLDQEADSKVAAPTDAEVQAFYQEHKDQVKQPLEAVKTQIHDGMLQAKIQQAREEYVHRLWQQTGVSILLSPPKTEVSYDPARVRGDPKAPVTIVEFSDFQCPFCQKTYPMVKDLLTKYAGRIKVAYRDFPLREIHPQSQMAAEAARCASDQGKFWEYHDLLFSNPAKLDHAGLLEEARALKLDDKAFDTCLTSGKFQPAVEEDLQAGMRAGISGTPGFFINGFLVSGAQPMSVFESAIDAELAAKEPPRASK